MKISNYFFFLLFFSFSSGLQATNYYINSATGKDSKKGTSPSNAWNTIAPLTLVRFEPGDSVLFATGQRFTGMLSLVNVKGLAQLPVVIGSYQYNGSATKPILDAGDNLNAILIQNSSFIEVRGLEITSLVPISDSAILKKAVMRCGILVEITKDEAFEGTRLEELKIHDVHLQAPGFTHQASEVKTANGTAGYGWGIRFINNSKLGKLANLQVLHAEIFNVSHTGLKITAGNNGIKEVTVAYCNIYQTGGPGMQFSGIQDGHIHHNQIKNSGSTNDTRNWGRGSGLWTWGCSNIVIENNRFENANGPGDSAGVHIDYNCHDVVVQYNLSANNAGGFCEILGNNFNCAYRYNISVNDGFRVKGVNGAFQEGKIFWLSGYQGNEKKKAGPYNSYFYNNSIYVSANIIPQLAVTSSAEGILIANNIFYFEKTAREVTDDQKKQETESAAIPHVLFNNNLYLRADNWPKTISIQDSAPFFGEPGFKNKGGLKIEDYMPANKSLVMNRGITVLPVPNDKTGLRIGLKADHDILGNPIKGQPDMGAIELDDKK